MILILLLYLDVRRTNDEDYFLLLSNPSGAILLLYCVVSFDQLLEKKNCKSFESCPSENGTVVQVNLQ